MRKPMALLAIVALVAVVALPIALPHMALDGSQAMPSSTVALVKQCIRHMTREACQPPSNTGVRP